MSVLKSSVYLRDLRYTVEHTEILERLRDKTIVITGATGLIGSGIVDLLLMADSERKMNISILAAVRNIAGARSRFEDFPDQNALENLSYFQYDAAKENTLDFQADYLIHAASNAHPKAFVENPVETMLSNIDGLKELLLYAREHRAKVLYVSSSEVYGKINRGKPLQEDAYGELDILNPRNAYASSKRAAETLCASYYRQYGVLSSIVRPGHIYGPTANRKDSRVGSSFAYCVAEGKDLVLKSEGKQLRSYCYVPDCAAAVLTVMVSGEAACAYNISNPASIISIRQLAELYAAEGGVNLRFDLPTALEKAAFNPMENSSLDSARLEGLGWKALFDAQTGTSHTIAALRSQ